jgi:hypothetical protein
MRHIVKLVSLTICESHNLRDSQTSRIIIHSEKFVLDPKFSQDSRVKISNDSHESRYEITVCKACESCYEICLQDLREVSLATKFLSARLVRSDSRYEISWQGSLLASLATKFLSVRLARSESRY